MSRAAATEPTTAAGESSAPPESVTRTGTVIIGTGFSGLGLAIALRKRGRRDFVIVEKADEVGGTWRDNTYPGCACDVPSHMYSFSFAKNPGWSKQWSYQGEILAYLKRLAHRHGLHEHIRFGTHVTGASWDEEAGEWTVTARDGRRFVSQFLASGIGALHIPSIPKLPGLADFQGRTFHSARWDHDYDLTGKRVAVIGTGASAVQFVPHVAAKAAHLDLYQRSAPWVMPRANFEIPTWLRTTFRLAPGAMRAYRNAVYWAAESLSVGLNGQRWLLRLGERAGRRHIERQIADPALRTKVTPNYTLGCKRILGSDDYYPALARADVEVITDRIDEVRPQGIVTEDGVERPVDAVIFGTGFHVTDAFDHLDIRGVGGRNMSQEWRSNGIQTHLGLTVAGYPNLFFLLGPNTGLGHNSVVFMIEAQIRYIVAAIEAVARHRARALDVRRGTQTRFNHEIQRRLANGVWSTGGCTSWYLDSQGVNRTVWPGSTVRYWLRTRRFDLADYRLLTPSRTEFRHDATVAGH